MTNPLATYSFLPWLRQGIANNISQTDNDPSVKLRASIPVRLSLSGTKPDGSALPGNNIDQTIQLYGPGDIVGIDSKAVIKAEPKNWITNFEPNYLPYIDFYEEDFPWRYTPAAPNGERLRPWITLIVLKEDEFEDGASVRDNPLPFFKLRSGKTAAELFPKSSELWAWAHVHVNTDLTNGAEPIPANPDVTNEISRIISQNPDLAYSRIICPRKLEGNTGYHAFLVPSFESGRLAGLGRPFPSDPATSAVTLSATESAWQSDANSEFPYYYRWYFRTGNVGDFEYLVNLLEPKPADKSVGVRDMDVLHPGSNLPAIDDAGLGGILKLGGALRVPFDSMKAEDQLEVEKYDQWDEDPYPHKFTEAMAERINLADDYTESARTVEEYNKDAGITLENDDGDPDPVITSPLYGCWHALQQRLLNDRAGAALPHRKNWVHELNLDPRFRVAAGLGTKVVQKGQEEYMQAAWGQVGKIVEANNKIRLSQMAKEISVRFYDLQLLPLLSEKAFLFTAPVHRRVVHQNFTVHKQVEISTVPTAVTSGTFRSVIRPRGTIMKRLNFDPGVRADNLIDRINEGQVVIAPPKTDPAGAINLPDLEQGVAPTDIPHWAEDILKKYKGLLWLLLVILLLVLLVVFLFSFILGAVLTVVLAVAAFWLFNKLRKWIQALNNAENVSQDSQTPESVDTYPKSPDFTITQPGSEVTPSRGDTDSEEAERFKVALKDVFILVNTKFPEPERSKLDLPAMTGQVVKSLDPNVTIPKRTLDVISFPPHIRNNRPEVFVPVMVHPEIDVPMYKPLADISSELFLPNLNKIGQNSITLLENNQKFIEAYMAGINHEMSRELLWREYPTDQRGTCFRQFWDVKSFLSQPDNTVAQLKERYRRILVKREISNLRYYYLMLDNTTTVWTPELLDEVEQTIIKEELRDIYPLNFWSKTNTNRMDPADPNSQLINELGTHNQRAELSGKTQLVLVIRGELLKKYPTAVVYAQKADWGTVGESGPKDVNEERVLVELVGAEIADPPESKLKTPLFEAKIDPDVYFFGFDLDDEEARGTLNPTSTADDPGWFFVLKERPGEPRFGLDIEKATTEGGLERIINWNNLSWKDIGTADGSCIDLGSTTITRDDYDSAIDQENVPVADDVQAKWSPTTTAAELAYILYQVPVMVGVHASRMLPK